MSSPHPKELLVGSPRGLVHERDGKRRSHAPIRWQFDEQGQHVEDSGLLIFESSIPFGRTFSGDGESEWIDAMIPGCGRCQVRRKDLEFSSDKSDGTGIESPGITSLKMRFTLDTEAADGLPNFFLATVGTSIKFLILQGRRELVGDDLFLESCPNLLELRLRGSVVEARIDLRDYRASHNDVELPVVSCR
ncbi:hypothetical protein PI124_g12279 [Phytophthora idaei]|nr:hypothetical protein PI124_g12279 [Phytophthora idaei]